MSDFKSLPVDFLFHFRSVSCLTSGPYVWSSLCFSQVPKGEREGVSALIDFIMTAIWPAATFLKVVLL